MKKRLHIRGFTLAEILITLVIIGFVGALGIPMIGQQKHRKPVETVYKHGTVECYYKNGQLYKYTADNVDNPTGTEEAVSDYCYYTVPAANRFIFQVVGAGGDGGTTSPSYRSSYSHSTGTISTGTDFKYELAAAPEWVQDEWDKQWNGTPDVVPTYTINSPIAGGGYGLCQLRRKDANDEDCNIYCAYGIETCPDECLYRITADGGDSGNAVVVEVESKVYASNDVTVTSTVCSQSINDGSGSSCYVMLSFGDGRYAKLTINSSAYGGSAYEVSNGVYADGSNGTNFLSGGGSMTFNGVTKLSQSIVEGREGTPGENYCATTSFNSSISSSPKAGSVDASFDSITYNGVILGIDASFGLAGGVGTNTMKLYESIPKDTQFRMRPAAKTATGTEYYSVVQILSNGVWEDFIISSSGGTGMVYADYEVGINDSESMYPFPDQYYPEALDSTTSSLTVAANGYTSRLASLISSGAIDRPGTSGYGSYPIVTSVEGVENAEHYINGVVTGTENVSGFRLDADPYTTECLNGSIATDGVCYATQGTAGAIAITW